MAALDTTFEVAKRPFLDIATDISGSLVYLDAGAGEVAHTSLGLSFLLGLGAGNVCELERASPEDATLLSLSGLSASGSTEGSDPPSYGRPPALTLSIFVTQLLTDLHPHIVKAILAHGPAVSRVQIFSSVTEHAHACQASTVLGVEAFAEYSSMLKQDLKGSSFPVAQLSIMVRNFPMHMCALDHASFVLPVASAAATMAKSGGCAAGLSTADPGNTEEDGEGAAGGLSLLAHALGGVAVQLGAKIEAYSVGPVSQQLAAEVSSLPLPSPPDLPGRPTPSLAMILVDRSLDLASPSMHMDHPLDQILNALPRSRPSQPARSPAAGRVEWRPLDMRVDLPSFMPSHAPGGRAAGGQLMGLELLNPSDRACIQRIEQLVNRKPKDALLLLRKWAKDALRQEKLSPSVRSKAGAVTAAELRGLTEDLLGHKGSALRQSGVVAVCQAAAQALTGQVSERWEAAGSLERQACMMLTQAQDVAGLHQALLDALGNAKEGKGLLCISDILSVLVLVYSLWPDADPSNALLSSFGESAPPPATSTGPFSPKEETALRAGLLSAIGACVKKGGPQQVEAQLDCLPAAMKQRVLQAVSVMSSEGSSSAAAKDASASLKREVVGLLDNLFKRLHYVAQARCQLRDLRRISSSDIFADSPATLKPLLRQLVGRMLQQVEVKDVVQPSTSGALTGLITKGLGRFGLGAGLLSAARPKQPWEHSAVLVFVVGGISCAEIREVQAELEEYYSEVSGGGGGEARAKLQVLLGGTALVSPLDVSMQLLA
mmetsp:Transcript_28477/g.62680  ORF Transcript_28477/g.62680 Transcript_28477/m.62680 type:complete len:773 (+) Transcript_28477:171-2489(+)